MEKNRDVEEWISATLSRDSARYVEQTVISLFGKSGKGGILSNIRNSIGMKSPIRKGYEKFFKSFF